MPQTPGTNQWVVTSAFDFQTALTAVETNSTLNTIVLTRDIITPSGINGFKLPKKIAHSSGKLLIQGNNSTIISKSGQYEPLLSRAFTLASPPSSASDLFDQIVIQDLNFDGTAAMSSKSSSAGPPPVMVEGLRIEGASNVLIDNCNFHNLDYGLILSCVRTGMVSNCVTDDIHVTSYTTTSTSTWNSSGNYNLNLTYTRNITFNKCTSHLFLNGLYGFLIEKSANVVMNDCKATGSTPGTMHHVLFDAQGGLMNQAGDELINNFNIYNITIETPAKRDVFDECDTATPTGWSTYNKVYLGSLIRIKAAGSLTASGSYVKIDGLHMLPGVANSMIINSSSTKGFVDLYVYNIPYINPGGIFATDAGVILSNANCSAPPTTGTIWEFKETFDAVNIFSATRWYNSAIPYYRLSDNFSFSSRSKNYLTNLMLINNKTVSQ